MGEMIVAEEGKSIQVCPESLRGHLIGRIMDVKEDGAGAGHSMD